MGKFLNTINRWKFDKKMRYLVTVSMVLTALVVLTVSTVSSVKAMTDQTRTMLEEQNDSMSQNFESWLSNYKSLAIAMIMDASIQAYLKSDGLSDENYYTLASDARDSLLNCTNMWSSMNFIAVVSKKFDSYIYKGDSALENTQFIQVYENDYSNCKAAQDGAMKIGFNNAYFKGNSYTLNIYYPVYNVSKLSGELGLLCMNFNDTSLDQIFSKKNSNVKSDISVIDTDGVIVSISDRAAVGTKVDYLDAIDGKKGNFTKEGKLYIYEKLKGWNFYVVSSIPIIELYRPSIDVIFLMAMPMIVMVGASLVVVGKVIKKAYKPLDKVVKKMDAVASGSLETRLDEEMIGEDFGKIAIGFNAMMEEIQVLMERVKLEQRQREQIRFNALQSQIQPHFLYNTLECIHWQALAEGNGEISTLVKALAKYYRICLSRGKDIIPIEQEVEHIRNYLIIQNMRYDNIIDSEIELDESLKNVLIPKLTLQPLVENSIYHGLKVKDGKKGKVTLSMAREGEDVFITLEDSGTGMSQEEICEMNRSISEYDESFGYGVRNVNKRIELLYGSEYGLRYKKNEPEGITVEIHIPYSHEAER
ncbi:cache domain-containing sensor histidine kinase [Anaerobium acetethylicum]|uniref:Two-component system, sensor histidine kinase YesM n=1 Tax=Anaerobium acetethylicum TaxID=1619234 RepID=A0A1D3TYK4_9FIRM|nr:histidine kinase [Anaerobium acetethylicum]SCP99533.1 two-component system, sensor histidine kinase YesM [Anaerobium acetethylicum]